jgi:pimeloyl-ACP methyl ester carboxylesterase
MARLDVDVPGGRLAAFRFGAARADAPAVLAVHGITANSHAWRPVARALGDRAALIAPDLRGRARSSELPGPYGMAAYVADLLALLDRLDLQRSVVVGHSLGAYAVARLAADHPARVRAAVLVDGGLTIPGIEDVDPQAFIEAFLGPAVARLRMRFKSHDAYHDWWRAHPAMAGSDVADADLVAYADHDLVGEAPELHSSVSQETVRADAAELFEIGAAAHRMRVRASLLCAPRGLQNDPNPMQPLPLAREWAEEAPEQRRALLVDGVNHYTITLGAAGAAAVADVIAGELDAEVIAGELEG